MAFFGADRLVLGVLLIIVLAFAISNVTPKRMSNGSYDYGTAAYNLITTGTYSADPGDTGGKGRGLGRQPLYPAFLALGMSLFWDHDSRDLMCLHTGAPECQSVIVKLKTMQAALVVVIALLVYGAALLLIGRGWLAVLAVALFALQGNAIFYVDKLMSEVLATAILVLHAYLLVRLAQDPRHRGFAVLAGITLGMLYLIKQIFIIYILGGIGLVAVAALFGPARRHVVFVPAFIALAVAAAVTGAWGARDIGTAGKAQDQSLRGIEVVAMRAVMDTLSWDQIWTSYLFYVPFEHGRLAKGMLAPDDLRTLGAIPAKYLAPGAGQVNIITQRIESDPRPRKLTKYLVPVEIIFENLPKHLALTPALLWRAMGPKVAKNWTGIDPVDSALRSISRTLTMLLIPAVFWAAVVAVRRRRWPMAVFLLPSLYLICIHPLITHGTARLTAPILPCAVVALCWLIAVYRRDRLARKAKTGGTLSPG